MDTTVITSLFFREVTAIFVSTNNYGKVLYIKKKDKIIEWQTNVILEFTNTKAYQLIDCCCLKLTVKPIRTILCLVLQGMQSLAARQINCLLFMTNNLWGWRK